MVQSDNSLASATLVLDEYIRSNGKKHTKQRNAILDVFVRAGGHLSLYEILALVQKSQPGVGFATIYRTMKLFVDAGIADEQRFGGDHAIYEISHGTDHHDHIICTECGSIFEFHDELIEKRQDVIAATFGVKVTHHRHVIHGKCTDIERCAAAKP